MVTKSAACDRSTKPVVGGLVSTARKYCRVVLTIVSVFAYFLITRQVAVVNPHVGGEIDGDAISICSKHFADLHIPNDHVLLAQNRQADAGQSYAYRSAFNRRYDGLCKLTAAGFSDNGLV